MTGRSPVRMKMVRMDRDPRAHRTDERKGRSGREGSRGSGMKHPSRSVGRSTIRPMDPHAIEAFARRDRELTSRSKAAYWADEFRRDRQSTRNAAQLLLAHAR